jgi:uncharacterized protein YjaZ
MGKINLLVTNANAKFSEEEIKIFENATRASERFINDSFDFDYDVDLVISSPSFLMNTIPEDGISGRTYNSNLIMIVVDRQQAKITEDMVYETICHEMSHSLRWEKVPEYSKTLFEGFILEGLAIVLEESAITAAETDSKQYFLKEIQNTDQDTIDRMIIELGDSFNNENYDYDTIFYVGSETIPRWAGYKLGYYFVKKYLQKTGETIAQATLASYKKFAP